MPKQLITPAAIFVGVILFFATISYLDYQRMKTEEEQLTKKPADNLVNEQAIVVKNQ